ncbi:hypothetical protein D3C87_1666280 [compost metagenome]
MCGIDLLCDALPLRLLWPHIIQVPLSTFFGEFNAGFMEFELADGFQGFVLSKLQGTYARLLLSDSQRSALLTSRMLDTPLINAECHFHGLF